MNELTESLDRAEPFPSGEEAYNRGEDCWIVDTIVVEAARKWAELEAEVKNGARVVVEKDCNQVDCKCERRIVLGEGATE